MFSSRYGDNLVGNVVIVVSIVETFFYTFMFIWEETIRLSDNCKNDGSNIGILVMGPLRVFGAVSVTIILLYLVIVTTFFICIWCKKNCKICKPRTIKIG